MFLTIAENEACARKPTDSPRFDHVDGIMLFFLPLKNRVASIYSGLYKFAQRMGMDPVLTFIVFH